MDVRGEEERRGEKEERMRCEREEGRMRGG